MISIDLINIKPQSTKLNGAMLEIINSRSGNDREKLIALHDCTEDHWVAGSGVVLEEVLLSGLRNGLIDSMPAQQITSQTASTILKLRHLLSSRTVISLDESSLSLRQVDRPLEPHQTRCSTVKHRKLHLQTLRPQSKKSEGGLDKQKVLAHLTKHHINIITK